MTVCMNKITQLFQGTGELNETFIIAQEVPVS